MLLQRNPVYTCITRGKKLVVVVGQRKALAIAVRNNKTENRFSGLLARLNYDKNPPREDEKAKRLTLVWRGRTCCRGGPNWGQI